MSFKKTLLQTLKRSEKSADENLNDTQRIPARLNALFIMAATLIMATILLGQICYAQGAKEIKFYSVSSGLMYMRVTEVIYNKSILMDNGKRKYPTKGNTFAQIMINFANLTDKPVKDYGIQPVTLWAEPENLALIGKSGRKYSGMNATKFLKADVKPFLYKVTLKPGEDMVKAMAFHVPVNDKIIGVVYRFDGGLELTIDYNDPSQIQPKRR